MTVFYDILDTIKTQLEADDFVNTVNFGGVDEALLEKKDMYPYSHLILNSADLDGAIFRFNFSIIAMDIRDISNDETTNIFIGNDNLHDILNTQLAVLTRLKMVLDSNDSFTIDGNTTFEHFTDRFEHGVAGWTMTFDILIKHNMTRC